jgi:uncharacterized protein DUF2852
VFHLHLLPPHIMHAIGSGLTLVLLLTVACAVFRRKFWAGRKFDVATAPSGNAAFDGYRRATLKKLELEADEFRKYLDGLRRAADAAAFQSFLTARRGEGGQPG